MEHTEWSKNPACYMGHKVIHKSTLLHGTQVIHKSSPLYGTQTVIHKSSLLHGAQSDPQIQPITWNTKWSTNPVHYIKHEAIHKSSLSYGTQTVIQKSSPLHGTQSDPQIQAVIWNTSAPITSLDSDSDVQTYFSSSEGLYTDTRVS